MTTIRIRHRIADAIVTDDNGHPHRVAYLQDTGWFCGCPAGRRCRLIDQVRELVVPLEATP